VTYFGRGMQRKAEKLVPHFLDKSYTPALQLHQAVADTGADRAAAPPLTET